jgi:hypothetical protein
MGWTWRLTAMQVRRRARHLSYHNLRDGLRLRARSSEPQSRGTALLGGRRPQRLSVSRASRLSPPGKSCEKSRVRTEHAECWRRGQLSGARTPPRRHTGTAWYLAASYSGDSGLGTAVLEVDTIPLLRDSIGWIEVKPCAPRGRPQAELLTGRHMQHRLRPTLRFWPAGSLEYLTSAGRLAAPEYVSRYAVWPKAIQLSVSVLAQHSAGLSCARNATFGILEPKPSPSATPLCMK